DVTHEVLVDRPHARAAIRGDGDEALAAQLLQRLAHRIARGAVAFGDFGDDQPLVGAEPPGDDVLADELVDRSAVDGFGGHDARRVFGGLSPHFRRPPHSISLPAHGTRWIVYNPFR